MQSRTQYLLYGLGAAVALWVFSRTSAGGAAIGGVVDAVLTGWRKVYAEKGAAYKPLFDAASAKYGLPPDLLPRVAYQESRFRPDIISGETRSSAGATGIMQIVPKWHPNVNALDPADAIPYAAKLLKQWRAQFGTWGLALAAYNAGPGNVLKYNGVPPFAETEAYVREVTRDAGVV